MKPYCDILSQKGMFYAPVCI